MVAEGGNKSAAKQERRAEGYVWYLLLQLFRSLDFSELVLDLKPLVELVQLVFGHRLRPKPKERERERERMREGPVADPQLVPHSTHTLRAPGAVPSKP